MTRAERLGLESGSVNDKLDQHEGCESPTDYEIEHSIAISLKRIADALDGTTLGVDITESLADLTWQQVYKS